MTTLCDIEFTGFDDDIPCNEPSVGVTEDGVNVCESCAYEQEEEGVIVYWDKE